MISLGSKFADYGLTAGFMICAQVALLFWVAPDTAHSIIVASATAARSYLELLPPSLATATSAVLAAFAIISIFFVGLILELIGSVAIIWEVNVFKRHLERNHQWLATFLEPYGQSTKRDLDRLMSEFGDPMGKQEWLEAVRLLYFWKRSTWTVALEGQKRMFRRFTLLRSFSRLQSLLLSYILAADSTPRLDFLRDHIHLCRISRAISAGLYILAFELIVFMLSTYAKFFWHYLQHFLSLFKGSKYFYTAEFMLWYLANLLSEVSLDALMWHFLVPALSGTFMLALAIFLPVKAYARFCDGLFSLVLVLHRKLNKEVSLEGHEDTKKA